MDKLTDGSNSYLTATVFLTVLALTVTTAFGLPKPQPSKNNSIMSASSKPVLPKGTIESSFQNCRNQKIHTIEILPKNGDADAAVAKVFLLHGIGDHCGRPCYTRLYEQMTAQNIHVYSMDHHGHGQSEGSPPVYCNKFQDYIDDYLQFMKDKVPELNNNKDDKDGATATKPKIPVLLVGHSLGGMMSILLAHELKDQLSGMVLTAPACGTTMDTEKKIQAFLAPLLNILVPKVLLVDAVRVENLTRNQEEVENYKKDSLIVKGKTATRTGIEILLTFGRIKKIQSEIKCPVLMMHGTDDVVTTPADSLSFFQNVSTPADQKMFVKLTGGMLHELYNEPEYPTISKMVVDFCQSGAKNFPKLDGIGEDRIVELDLISSK